MASKRIIPQLLSCQALKELLGQTPRPVVVLEADLAKQVEADFKAGHIPTARYFDQLQHTTPTAYLPRGLPDIKKFEEYMGSLGVSNDDHIVLYDRSAAGFFAAGRAWFLFKTYGVDNLSILNGGYNGWVRENNDIEKTEPAVCKDESKKFTVKLNDKMVRYYEQMMANLSLPLDSPDRVQVVDARPPNLFNGTEAGRMPNALSLPYGTMFDQANQYLKPNDQLTELFKKAGVDLSKPAFYTCQGGITASVLAFIADLLGQKEKSVYMGAFIEWQQRAPPEMIIKGDIKPPAN